MKHEIPEDSHELPERELKYLEEEFKALKKELSELLSQTWKLEVYVVGAVAAFYAWAMNSRQGPGPIWWIPATLPLLGGFRCLALYFRMEHIGDYLRGVERRRHVSGWETHLGRSANRKSLLLWMSVAFWIIIFLITLAAPFLLPRHNTIDGTIRSENPHPPLVSIRSSSC